MLFNALANQCDSIPLLCLSPHHFCLAIARQYFARPLRFIELRFHELHFLCITPSICAMLCLYLSLRVKTSPHLCLSKFSLASPLPIKTVLCIPSLSYAKPCQTLHGCAMPLRIIAILSPCESMSINAVPLLIDARPLLCHSQCYS